MIFGRYTVFDTPEENKHTQVYVEYNVPNKDNLDGASGRIFLTEGGEGHTPPAGSGFLSCQVVLLNDQAVFDPAIESVFPIFWENFTEEQQHAMAVDGYPVIYTFNCNIDGTEAAKLILTPTPDMRMYDFEQNAWLEPGQPGVIIFEPYNETISGNDVFCINGTDWTDSDKQLVLYFEIVKD